MEKLRIASTRLQWLVIVFMFLTPLAVVVSVMTQEWAELLNLPTGIQLNPSRITGLGLLVMIGLGSVTALSHLVAFWFLYRLLGLYRKGIIFAAENVAAIRLIGWALIAIDVAQMLKIVITGPILTYLKITSPYGSVGIQIAFLIVGLFVVLVSYVIDMGRELKEQDNLVI